MNELITALLIISVPTIVIFAIAKYDSLGDYDRETAAYPKFRIYIDTEGGQQIYRVWRGHPMFPPIVLGSFLNKEDAIKLQKEKNNEYYNRIGRQDLVKEANNAD